MTKTEWIVATLRRRLELGDYALRPFPAERDLAQEFAVSYMTARKAVVQLVVEGLLERQGRGRTVPARRGEAGLPNLTLLAVGWPARTFQRLHRLLVSAAPAAGMAYRDQRFVHWDDPAVTHTLARSQGVVVLPPAGDLPETALVRIAEARARTVFVGADLSAHGIRSIDHLPAEGIRLLLDHLAGQGHRRIAVLNVQPPDHAIRARLAEVGVWARARQEVVLVDAPVAPGQDVIAAARAAAAPLFAGAEPPTAVVGTTLPAAQGAVRAAADRGIAVGGGLAVAAMDGEELADLLVPAITTVDIDGLDRAVADAVEWMAGGAWAGSLLHRCRPILRERESTPPR